MVDKEEFISAIAPAAVKNMKESGVLASITIAQAALESAWGLSAPGNNLFGIKGSGTTQDTREYINGEWITVKAGFRSYDSWLESIEDHSRFLEENPRYANAGFFEASEKKDYAGAAQALQAAGYATDPSYAKKLIFIIERNRLDAFDKEVEEALELSNYQRQALVDALKSFLDQKLITDPSWVEKAKNGQLTLSELTWLNTIILLRK